MQLPPVSIGKELEFCFESPVWEAAAFNIRKGTMSLKQVERQKDRDFVKFLNEVRLGHMSEEFLALLHGCLIGNKAPPENGIIPTKLYSNNREVRQLACVCVCVRRGAPHTPLCTVYCVLCTVYYVY
jgi:hypothetical protein